MNGRLQHFIDGLLVYDYALFGASLVLFILFIVLAIILRNKLKTALFLLLLAFSVVILGPTYGYVKMHEYLFKNKVELTAFKKLSFVQAVVIRGKITNESKRDFSSCKIVASAYKITANKYKNMVLKLKPFKKTSIIENNILKNETKEFKMIMEPFRYGGDFNISLEADCR